MKQVAAALAVFAGAVVLRWDAPWAGWPLLLAAMTWAARIGPRDQPGNGKIPSRNVELLAVVSITAIAGWLRFRSLDAVPPGCWFDEAENGLETLRLISGDLFVFTPANNGRGALQFFWTAPFFALFGVSLFALRAAIATAGTLTIPAVWLLFRRLTGPGWALLGAGLLAVSSWHLHVSRIAFDVAFTPLIDVLSIHAAMIAAASGSAAWSIATGALAAIANYGYQASRITPLIVAPFLGRRRPLALAAVAFALAMLPLAAYALTHPRAFAQRGRQVNIARDMLERRTVAPLIDSISGTVRMFHEHGDDNPRHNDPGRPMLDPVTGTLFILGLAWGRRLAPPGAFRPAIVWLALPLVFGGVLTMKAPHANRTVAALPAVCLFATWGARGLIGAVRWRPAVAALLMAGAGAFGVTSYFGGYASYRGLAEAFSAAATDVGEYVRSLPPGTSLRVEDELNPSVVAFVSGRPFGAIRSLPLDRIRAEIEGPGVIIVRDASALGETHGSVKRVTGRFGTSFDVVTVAP